jgi:hypothetical protein
LEAHLRDCEDCRSVLREYEILADEGFRILANAYDCEDTGEIWDEEARHRLLAGIGATETKTSRASSAPKERRLTWRAAWVGALAASIVACVIVGAWGLGNRQGRSHVPPITPSAKEHVPELEGPRKSPDAALVLQFGMIAQLQAENAARHAQIKTLQGRLQVLQQQVDEERRVARKSLGDLQEAKAVSEGQERTFSLQRDKLSEELRDARLASERIEGELAGLHSEHEEAVRQVSTLESRLKEVTAVSQEQQQRLKDAEEFLASDRDIRNLMSARNLYIADVFDVDGSSRTRKPFGRIFYTQGKSLLFYAFDLDRQPRVKETSTFQAWGQKETAQGETARALDLGILYLDSEANRRWVLRSDDPQTLSEIDAVFVTIEPHGGSRKPTGKPFLFAMLRKEANHP